ncbi:MAG: fused MFS/spermidine synthase [Pseudomonadota bacterium]
MPATKNPTGAKHSKATTPSRPWWLFVLFSFAIFTSAALIFMVQPMVGKMLLPLVGGVPAGWVVAMAFFQTALLVGYLIAHLCSKLKPHHHGLVHLGLVAVAAISLPLGLEASLMGDSIAHRPILSVIVILAIGTGLPFVALAATGPTLQRLFATNRYGGEQDPYFLYAISNIGSLLGLISYPIVIEPIFALDVQGLNWAYAYGALAISILLCTLLVNKDTLATQSGPTGPDQVLSHRERGYIIACAAVPSSLLIGVTTLITTDIASTPLLWIIPLSLYLVTMIIAFSRRRLLPFKWIHASIPLVIFITLITIVQDTQTDGLDEFVIHLTAFTIIALSAHGKLADARPPVENLTEYYLLIAIGGALGGAMTACLSPLLFSWYWEYPVALLAMLVFVVGTKNYRLGLISKAIISLYILSHMVGMGSSLPQVTFDAVTILQFAVMGTILVAAGLLFFNPRYSALTLVFTLILADSTLKANPEFIGQKRSFFGIVQLHDEQRLIDGDVKTVRLMNHGSTTHGMQILEPFQKPEMLAYYNPAGPHGDIFQATDADNVALVGLGTGTLSCYQKPNQRFTFYEIDPLVEQIARRYFDYVKRCGEPTIRIGDGRLELMREDKDFDLILIDAFSSDAVPIHLMTVEAIDGYLSKLNDGGLVGFHISNRFVDLSQPLMTAAHELRITALIKSYVPSRDDTLALSTQMVVMTRNTETIEKLRNQGWAKLPRTRPVRLWTDQYSNLLSVMPNLPF